MQPDPWEDVAALRKEVARLRDENGELRVRIDRLRFWRDGWRRSARLCRMADHHRVTESRGELHVR